MHTPLRFGTRQQVFEGGEEFLRGAYGYDHVLAFLDDAHGFSRRDAPVVGVPPDLESSGVKKLLLLVLQGSKSGLESGLLGFWGFRTMPISVPGHADHRFRVDGDHDSGMMPITRSGMIPIS